MSSPALARHTVLVQLNSLSLGGTQINAVDFAARLTNYGYDSVLIGPRDTLPSGPSLLDIAREKGVRVEIFDRPTSVVAGARFLSRRARECGAEVVHVYGSTNARSAFWGPALLARRPLVLTVYEMGVDAAEFASPPLIVGTGYLVDDLHDRPGPTILISPPVDLSRDRVSAVDTTDFRHMIGDPANDQRLVVLVSRLDEEMKAKSVELAIHAVARSGRDDLVLVIVGAGDAETRLREIGSAVNARLGRAAIVFVGPMADPRAAYASADVALGMGGSAARALAFGKPLIVLGEFGWIKSFTPDTAAELFRNSFWSDEVMPEAVDYLSREIDDLAADGPKRARLAAYGREFSVAHFGLEAMAGRLADTYDRARADYRARDWARDLDLEWRALRSGTLSRLAPSKRREIPTTTKEVTP